jgi:hypothetical protein
MILLLIGAWILRASIGKRSEMLTSKGQTDTND